MNKLITWKNLLALSLTYSNFFRKFKMIIVLVLFFSLFPNKAIKPSEISDVIRRGIVKITTNKYLGTPRVGSGFIVAITKNNKVFIVTATHVVLGTNKVDIDLYGYESVSATVLEARQEESDIGLAILVLTDNKIAENLTKLSISEKKKINMNNKVITLGFPGNVVKSDYRLLQTKTINDKILILTDMSRKGSFERFSGGPIINMNDKKVIGIVQKEFASPLHKKTREIYAIPASVIRSFLKEYDIPLDDIYWIMDKTTGCKVWNMNIDKTDEISWSARCDENKYAQGYGMLTKNRNGKKYITYTGNIRNGKLHGRGIFKCHSEECAGEKFEGEFFQGQAHNGHYKYPSGKQLILKEGKRVY